MKKDIAFILKQLCDGLVEKDEAMRLALLTAIAGESIFFLGLPGTAKSMVSRRLRSAFKGKENQPVRYFEYLMNQFSTPDELFGPVSLKSLENDEYKRIVKGYLPDAEVAFLDEIWKASPAIQNTLLTIINEKKFHNGNSVEEVPLKALISASNELPAENQGLEALWDRFLVRLMVNPVREKSAFLQLVCGHPVKADIEALAEAISMEDLQEWKSKIDDVVVPQDVQNAIDFIHAKMWKLHVERPDNNLYYISDRRWMKIVRLLKTSAFLNGRTEVDLMDCSLISHCIWNSNDVIDEVSQIVNNAIIYEGADFATFVDSIGSKIQELDQFVEANFLEECPKMYKMKDGTMAYKIVNPQAIHSCVRITPYYVSPENVENPGCFYDWNSERFDSTYRVLKGSLLIQNNTIKWKDNYSRTENVAIVEMELQKSSRLFDCWVEAKPKMVKMSDGQDAFELEKAVDVGQNNIKMWVKYVTPDYKFYGDQKKLCSELFEFRNCELIGSAINFDLLYNGFNYHYSEKIIMLPGHIDKEKKERLNRFQVNANFQYDEIEKEIENDLSHVREYLDSHKAQYLGNLFATDESVAKGILREVSRIKDEIENKKVELDRVKDKYINLKSNDEEQE